MKIDPANLDWIEGHTLLLGAIVPRPIAFVSTIGEDGVFNLAPFSLFAPICLKPMLVGISIGRTRNGDKKDTLVNIESSKEFVVNLVTESMAEAMSKSSGNFPIHVDEFKEVGLTPVKADIVKPPMVGESPISMECQLSQIMEFGTYPRLQNYIIGEIVRFHISDELYVDGEINESKLMAIGQMGGSLYCRMSDLFELKRQDTGT